MAYGYACPGGQIAAGRANAYKKRKIYGFMFCLEVGLKFFFEKILRFALRILVFFFMPYGKKHSK